MTPLPGVLRNWASGTSARAVRWTISALVLFLWWTIPRYVPFLTGVVIVAGGLWWLGLLAWKGGSHRQLWLLLGVAYGVRFIAAIALFFISWWHLPIFVAQQASHGFWRFAPDARAYHLNALRMLEMWRANHSLPDLFVVEGQLFDFGPEYFLSVMGIYEWFGPHPLHAILVNVWCSTFQVLLGVWMMRAFGREKQALWAGWAIALWPSAILWSAQLLKDALCVTLIMLVLTAFVALQRPNVGRRQRVSWWVILGVSTLALTRFRFYLGLTSLIAAGVMLCVVAVRSLIRRRVDAPWPLVLSLVTIALSATGGSLLPDLRDAFSSRDKKVEKAVARSMVTKVDDPLAHQSTPPPPTPPPPTPPPRRSSSTPPAVTETPVSVKGQGDAVRVEPVVGQRSGADKHTGSRWERFRTKLSLDQLSILRVGFLGSGGGSLVNPGISVTSTRRLLRSIPKALTLSILAPFPGDWFRTSGSTGIFKAFSGIEMALVYLCLPFLLRGSWRMGRMQRLDSWYLLMLIGLMIVGMGLVVANVGTLFRLRLSFLTPWLAIGIGLGLGPKTNSAESMTSHE